MGRGSKSHETGVKKERLQATLNTGTGIGGSAAKRPSSDNCLFSFTAKVTTTAIIAAGIKVSSSVVLVPHHSTSNRIEIFIDGKNVGTYAGKNLNKILSCISQGFTYEGNVLSVNSNKNSVVIVFQITGR